jgi:hypothetical protein
MSKFWRALKMAAKGFADAGSPGEYAAAGKKILCAHCGGNVFAGKTALLNTKIMTFLDFDWADPSATTLACINCGYVQWFAKKPESL